MIYKLAFAVSEYTPYGGMQRTMVRIARMCAARGHQVDIYTCKWTGPDLEDLNVTILKLDYWTNHGQCKKLGEALSEIVAQTEYDCVVGFSKMPGLDVYYGGDPCFAEKLSTSRPGWVKLLPRYRVYLQLETAVFGPGLETEILLIAHQEQAHFITHYGTEPERFHQLPPGINRDALEVAMSQAKPDELRRELGIGEEDEMILCVGSWFRPKGVDRAVLAMAALPKEILERSYLVVVGDGRPQAYRKMAAKLGVAEHVIFTGGRSDVANFYLASSFLLHPAYIENTGTIIIEAMVCGLPVLATAICGFSNHVEQANAGLVCPQPFEQRVLDAQVLDMLTNPSRPEWSENARHYCTEKDLYSLIDKATDLIVARSARNRANR